MTTFNDSRIRLLNTQEPDSARDYVLYWVHGFRRLNRNHALDYALRWCEILKKPLVIYEGLRLDYPWASIRHHRFILEGMLDHVRLCNQWGMNYWPFVETPGNEARGLLTTISKKACLVVSDDHPGFIIPGQNLALAKKIDVPLFVVDSNSLIPLQFLGPAVSVAAHLRPRIHKLFAESWQHRAVAEPVFPKITRTTIPPPFELWPMVHRKKQNPESLATFLDTLALDRTVPAVKEVMGGTLTSREVLHSFIREKLSNYAEGRIQPDDPKKNSSSRLSPYLHYGHISIQEIVESVLNVSGEWTPDQLNSSDRGKREGYFHKNPNVNSFLDEAITWRDLGYHWHFMSDREKGMQQAQATKAKRKWSYPTFCDLMTSIPDWAAKTLRSHAKDSRAYTYTLQEWESGQTHDPLWNAAQRELVVTGRIHNYLRMLWGKKVLEWSSSPEEAYLILEHLNNKYALDGRDPNSYTGILWCFGLFDRPWSPERKVLGTIRYMSSDNTAKKFDLEGYYRYIDQLPSIATARSATK
jgi:deoxyribodipyrimidine photo-lyase